MALGMMSTRVPPTRMPTKPWSNPEITVPAPNLNWKGCLPTEVSNWVPRKFAAVVRFDPAQCGSTLEGSNHGPAQWLADTGCRADLFGLNDMTAGDVERIEKATERMCFSTANEPV